MILSQGDSMFNGAILVMKDGKEIVRQNYGAVDFEKTGDIDDNSRFNVGSLSKELPAIAILDFILKGKLSYENTLHKYIDGLPQWAERVTIKDILFYTSGLPPLDFSKSSTDEKALIELGKIDTLMFSPGEGYLYSNWNNFLQAQIIESLSGQDFRTFILNEYINHLSIENSFYDSSSPRERNNMTRSYSETWGDDEYNYARFNIFELSYGPLYMTNMDLAKWIEYIGKRYDPNIEEVATFYQETDLNSLGPLGIVEFENGELVAHKHGGYAYSFGTTTYRDYKNRMTIVLMTNRNRADELDRFLDKIMEVL